MSKPLQAIFMGAPARMQMILVLSMLYERKKSFQWLLLVFVLTEQADDE